MPQVVTELLEAWKIHNRINLYLLEAVEEVDLATKVEKARSVRSQFAHIVNVRGMWIKSANPSLLDQFIPMDKDTATKSELLQGLEVSGDLILEILSQSYESGIRVKGFKPTTAAFQNYLISHESHHRGMIEFVLRQAGKPISDKVSFGLWEWGTR